MSVRSALAILGRQQGSGVLVAPDLVLTSAHVVGDAFSARAAAPDRPLKELRVVWVDHGLDAALLRAAEPLGPAPRLSGLTTDRPIQGCEILGYPRIQRYEGRKLDLDQFTGTVLPLAGRIRGLLTVELDHPPVTAEEPDGPSPLAGLSGAPVFAADGLIGIVRSVPRGRGHRRLECVPLSTVTAQESVRQWLPDTLLSPADEHPADRAYEAEYAAAVGAAYRRTRIFGLDELGKRASEWDLDTAYLSLEATARTRETVPVPRRIDDLLADRPRVLLRGDAGAGKTTLVWWLAAHAAAGTLGPGLAALNGLVPFVVPLRSLRAKGAGFPAPGELPGVAGLMVDAAPDGWAGRVLAAGRGLLLVDGLDEVTQDDRDDAHTWLSGLLARFPDTRCVATVRPHAVAPDWLGAERFDELTLLPLRGEDIQAFVTAWHDAARLDADAYDRAALDELERDLAQQFRHNPNLAELARTPLLCAVICALHRLRDGLLPETRWELYDSALTMLLGTRDERRRVGSPDGIRMSVEEHRQLLQRLAVRLVRTGQTEFTREQALQRLEHDLPGMPRIRAQGTPEEILTHLINRSGLLQERTDDVFQFTHRTFQDFLAAKELVEDDALPEALLKAHDQQWHDVLLLAAGHCRRSDLPLLVEGLLKAGSGTRKRDLKTTLYVMAALAAQHGAWLEEGLRRRVRKAVTSMIPPRSPEQLVQLSRLGAYVLPLLPGPEEVAKDSADQIVDLIGLIGTAAGLPHARAYARAGQWRISVHWERFPAEAFARDVLSQVPDSSVITVTRAEQARHVRHAAQVSILHLRGNHPSEVLRQALTGWRPLSIRVSANAVLTDLDVLRSVDCTRLRILELLDCPMATDLTALADLSGLKHFRLTASRESRPDLRPFIGHTAHIMVTGVPRKNILGAAALGDRLTVE
ncbi:NACHT domain-containing protein [Streptomyces sp. SKN60]|uniref:serine protease n=1 Tax=Streptomyces sp. SKN60 TaxID=2855506 RepID=UPI00224621FD|nr:serine protease [Streptomyces sp. SKN60]MCX2182347.1 NACHT domain-containing protein [Streptomyces sp. SKN60]